MFYYKREFPLQGLWKNLENSFCPYTYMFKHFATRNPKTWSDRDCETPFDASWRRKDDDANCGAVGASAAAKAPATVVELVMEGPPGQVGPLPKMKTSRFSPTLLSKGLYRTLDGSS